MAYIELQGLTPTVIITNLGKLSITTVLTRREMSYSGRLHGLINGVKSETTNIRFSGGYLLRVDFSPILDVPYPLHISTSGSIVSNCRSDVKDLFVYKEGDFQLIDNLLVLHDSKFVPVSRLAGSGVVYAQKDLPAESKTQSILDGETNCYECRMYIEGETSSTHGLAGEIMELDGSFKLKLRKGKARRESSRSYPLYGDQEFVLNGHVVAEVGSVSMFKERRYLSGSGNAFYADKTIAPSFVKVSAQGQLVI